jgi:hypothetical protein
VKLTPVPQQRPLSTSTCKAAKEIRNYLKAEIKNKKINQLLKIDRLKKKKITFKTRRRNIVHKSWSLVLWHNGFSKT